MIFQNDKEFRGLYQPPAVEFRFDTPGWYLLAFILLLIVAVFLIRNYRRDRYRREALRELKNLSPVAGTNVNQVLIILKRTAIAVYGRKHTAALTGDKWFEFLDNTSGRTRLKDLAALVENSMNHGDVMSKESFGILYEQAIKWIKTHGRKF